MLVRQIYLSLIIFNNRIDKPTTQNWNCRTKVFHVESLMCASHKEINKQTIKRTDNGRKAAALDYTFFGVDVEKRQKGDFGMAVVGAIISGLRPCTATLVTAPGRLKPRPHGLVGPGQVHHRCGARIHFADGQALEVRPVGGGQARPRGLLHGEFEVEQVHHVVNVVTRRRYAILCGTI